MCAQRHTRSKEERALETRARCRRGRRGAMMRAERRAVVGRWRRCARARGGRAVVHVRRPCGSGGHIRGCWRRSSLHMLQPSRRCFPTAARSIRIAFLNQKSRRQNRLGRTAPMVDGGKHAAAPSIHRRADQERGRFRASAHKTNDASKARRHTVDGASPANLDAAAPRTAGAPHQDGADRRAAKCFSLPASKPNHAHCTPPYQV